MATSFFDLQLDRRLMPVDEYLASIDSPVRRSMIEHLLVLAPSIYPFVQRSCPNLPEDPPHLKIRSDPAPGAQCMEGMIEINSGLIDFCLGGKYLSTHEVLGLDTDFVPQFVPTCVLTWFYAHECFHIARQHNHFLENVEVDHETLRAIERDADLCAVAVLYRGLQSSFGFVFGDQEIRKLTLYSVFWALRNLTDAPQLTHCNPDQRFFHAMQKINLLNVDPMNPNVDVDGVSPEFHERLQYLIPTMIEIERAYRTANPNDTSSFDLLGTALATVANKGDSTTGRWEVLRQKFIDITGQRA